MVIDRDNIKILLILLIVGLGLGYAYINSDLNINGTAQVNSANWDVHWANIQVTTGSVSESNVVTQPTISNGTTINYSINLTNPGDYYEFTVDAVNGGSLDAMIDTIDSKLNGSTITSLPAYLKYSVTYLDDIPLETNHQLLHNTTETYKVRIEYRDDINANQLPSTNRTLNLQFTVTYRQANENAVQRLYYIYTGDYGYTGASVSHFQNVYYNYTSFINDIGYPAFIRHLINNGVVEETYLGFVKDNKVYYLKGFDDSNAVYQQNVNTLVNAIGNSNCSDIDGNKSCTLGNISISIYNVDGSIGVSNEDQTLCLMQRISNNEGYSFCGAAS